MQRTSRDAARIGNIINVIMGAWLFMSTFAWPHPAAVGANTMVAGLVIAILALAALVIPALSWVDALPAVWLFTTTLWLHHDGALTPWHNFFVAGVVFVASTTPFVAYPRAGEPGEPGEMDPRGAHP